VQNNFTHAASISKWGGRKFWIVGYGWLGLYVARIRYSTRARTSLNAALHTWDEQMFETRRNLTAILSEWRLVKASDDSWAGTALRKSPAWRDDTAINIFLYNCVSSICWWDNLITSHSVLQFIYWNRTAGCIAAKIARCRPNNEA